MKKLLALLTISTLLVVPTSSSFLINKVSNISANYYAENDNQIETKINEIWSKHFKNKLNSAQKFLWILEDLKEKLKKEGLDSIDIKLKDQSEKGKSSRFKFNESNQKLELIVNSKAISLETGKVEMAWKPMKYKGKTSGEDTYSKEKEFDASGWDDQNFTVYELGYYDDGKGQIQAIKLPKGVVSIPKDLPREITSLKELFKDAKDFNDQNVKNWDTSNVEIMESMFEGAKKFNQDLEQWNTKNVTDMSFMFLDATEFNGKISTWNTSKVITMSQMFKDAKNFNQNINTKYSKNKNTYSVSWDVSKVKNMQSMFEGTEKFNSDLYNWNTRRVSVMRKMFNGATSFNKDISNFDVKGVVDFTDMFKNATSFNKNLSNWALYDSEPADLDSGATSWLSYYKPRSRRDTSNIIKKSDEGYLNTTNSLYDEEITKLIDKHKIEIEKQKAEAEARKQKEIPNKIKDIWNKDFKDKLDSAKKFEWILEELKDKFKKEDLLKNIQINLLDQKQQDNRFKFDSDDLKTEQVFQIKFDDKQLDLEVGKVKRAWKPVEFKGKTRGERTSSKEDEWDISYWDDKDFEVYELGYYDDGKQIQAIKLPRNVKVIPDHLPKEITSTKELFAYSNQFNDEKIKKWDMSNIEDTSGMFLGAAKFNQDLSGWDTSNVKNMSKMFLNAKEFNSKIFSKVDNVTDMSSMFLNAITFGQDLSSWQTDKVKNMNSMFLGATNFNQNLNEWNVENVTDMSSMFKNATSFNNELSKWKPKKVIDMSHMFEGAIKFDQEISSWNVSSVKNMQDMFKNASTFNKDLKDWNIASVSNMEGMFELATKFNGNISNWDTRNVESMSGMFKGAASFNKDISDWNTSNVKDMSYMFSDAISFNQNINTKDMSNKKAWDVSKVTDMEGMFSGAIKFNSELSKWNTSNVNNMSKMFKNAKVFNNNISNFDIKNVKYLNNMFENASAFNQDLSKWTFKHLKNKDIATESYDLNATSWKAEWKPDSSSNTPTQPAPLPQPQPQPKPVQPAPVPQPEPQPEPKPVEPTPAPTPMPQPVPTPPVKPIHPITTNKTSLLKVIKKDQLGEINYRSANEILKKLVSLNKDVEIKDLYVRSIEKNSAIISAKKNGKYLGDVLVSFNIKKPDRIIWENSIFDDNDYWFFRNDQPKTPHTPIKPNNAVERSTFNNEDDWFLYPVITPHNSTPNKPVDPIKPNKPDQPVKPSDPEPSDPIKPTDSTKPITPTKPIQPTDNKKPDQPKTPENKPNNQAKPDNKPQAKNVNNKTAFVAVSAVSILAILAISSVVILIKKKKNK
ncbi:BspA family leucine-rich repeat surface protein [Mycoplasma mycoides]|uniref:BspA family leucine-rich repeat surface protein n=1 Tax=Mycoplasma mycoides TaxID=2102 RepID=UPI002733B604|nr:BspA family leucine-rich repeat surface protein [Mycoplasma mycoides]MDP4040141.1 BspA family leucine-rich repeat surface protein [Mycoplasma mycoides]MDP4040895.1 BspA family leucine-rich repeat surface protein [Mycoplasma mycoides]MDP4041902.1 BspA family leucine-rich repeat surface protein [Mycoplasma mycoides]MDP4043320.1 BspA family leucine-rich repeat surface protein [Mycoplasma mycoides]MDP4044187.1 BspA family leucine-rich repeat surface protein [Mycoplasma mycoides]